MTLVTLLNLARTLRAQGLFTKAPAGRGYDKIVPTPHEIANFILAQAAGQASEAAETISRSREMKFRGTEPPVFGPGTFGEVIDRMVSGRFEKASEPADDVTVQLPNEIRLSTNPYRAVLLWRPDGKKPWANSYTPDVTERPIGSNFLFKETFIHPAVIELAWQVTADHAAERKSASPGRPTLSFDQSPDTAAEQSDTTNSEATPRVCFLSIRKTDIATELAGCYQNLNVNA